MSCKSKSCLSETPAQSAYRMAVQAVLRPGTACVGSGPGPGVSCGEYGALRRTIGGRGGIQDPTLVQRSYISSGCAPTRLNDMPDTQKDPVTWVNPCGAALNKGAAMQSVHTRNSLINYASVNEQNVSPYALQIGNRWSSGYHGMSAVGGNISTRLRSACDTEQRFKNAECSYISRGSFGSYGM